VPESHPGSFAFDDADFAAVDEFLAAPQSSALPASRPSGTDEAVAGPEFDLDSLLPDLDWTVLPEGVTRRTLTVPSGELAALEAGDPDGPRVVLVPGVTGSKEDFVLMMPLLAAAGYSVLAYDMAGQYESHAAGPHNLPVPAKHYTHDLFVNDLLTVLESTPGAAHVLGYSFAGTVAQLALSARPDLFLSLTLLSAPPQSGQGFRGVKRIGKISGFTTGRAGAALMIWGVKENFTKVPPGRLKFVRDRFALTRRSSVADIISLMKKAPDLDAVLAASTIPKLVAVGEHDLWPVELHRNFAAAIGADLAVYPTGHSPCETSPHQLVRDLLALYSK
jgi:pimeloyl-ACP methyl ester carboxylesterase